MAWECPWIDQSGGWVLASRAESSTWAQCGRHQPPPRGLRPHSSPCSHMPTHATLPLQQLWPSPGMAVPKAPAPPGSWTHLGAALGLGPAVCMGGVMLCNVRLPRPVLQSILGQPCGAAHRWLEVANWASGKGRWSWAEQHRAGLGVPAQGQGWQGPWWLCSCMAAVPDTPSALTRPLPTHLAPAQALAPFHLGVYQHGGSKLAFSSTERSSRACWGPHSTLPPHTLNVANLRRQRANCANPLISIGAMASAVTCFAFS